MVEGTRGTEIFQSDDVIFSLLNTVGHTQNATIQLIENEIGSLSIEEKLKKIQLKDSQDGYTPLMWAARHGSDDVIRYFVKCLDHLFFIIDQTGGRNQATALMIAVEFNRFKALSALIDLKANLDIKNDHGCTALMLAAERGQLEIVVKLVESRANLNMQNKFGYTALMMAAEKGHTSIIKVLSKEGADKAIVNHMGKTALIIAAENNYIDCITALFDGIMVGNFDQMLDTKINHQCNRGMTALMSAASRGHNALVALLLDRGADSTLRCKDGNFALTYAFIPHSRYLPIIQRLMARPLPKDLKNNKGCTPFMLAAASGKLNIVELLLDGKSEVQIEKMSTAMSEDNSNALHLAAAKGHIKMFLYLMNRFPKTMSSQNKRGKTPTQLLASFYTDNEMKFSEFIDESKSSRFKRELFELIPELLPKFKSPNSILNEHFGKSDNCFKRILLSTKTGDEIDIVTNLVNLAVGLKLAMDSSPLEAADLEDRLSVVQQVLLEVIRVPQMDNTSNILVVLECRKILNKEFSEKLHCARTFIQGPLMLCLRHKFLTMLGTRQLYVFVDNAFICSLRVRKPRPLEALKDIFQMRSNCVNWRTNPAFNFYIEGFCKFMTFCFVTVLLWQQAPLTLQYIHPNYSLDVFYRLHIALEVIILGWVLCEFGKLQFLEFDLNEYFWELWVYLDVTTVALHVIWSVFSLLAPVGEDYGFIATGSNVNITSSTITNHDIPQPPSKCLLALTAVLLSINFLKYMSISNDIGHYVLMLMAMFANTRNFFLIFLVCTFGFVIAFHGLFPYMSDFRTTERTLLELFFSLNGQFNASPLIFEGDPNETVGILLFVAYITMSGTILINIMTGTFAAIYDDINDQAKANWCYMKAKIVQQYLLVKPKNPFYMLPSPFNLIPLVFAPLHYAYINISRRKVSRMDEKLSSSHNCSCDCKGSNTQNINHGPPILSICGTVSDITIGLLMLFPCAFYEMYLLLREIKKYQKKQNLFWKCLLIAVVGFPFFYLGFVITLFIEILRVRTWFVLNESGEVQVLYDNDSKPMESTPPIALDPKKDYISLTVKVVQAEMIDRRSFLGSQLSRSTNVYAVVTIEMQKLVTRAVPWTDSKPVFRDAKKDFLLCLEDSDSQTLTARVAVYDDSDTLLGTTTESISKWVTSEHYEGSLDLKLNSDIVGHIFIVAETVDEQKRNRFRLIEVPVEITSVSAQVTRCLVLDTKAISRDAPYCVRLSLGGSSAESSLMLCDGDCLAFNQLLCVSEQSTFSDEQNGFLEVELVESNVSIEESKSESGLKNKLKSNAKFSRSLLKNPKSPRKVVGSNCSSGTVLASRIIALNREGNADINGELDMLSGNNCVCKIELSIKSTNETVMIQKPKTAQFLWKTAQSKVLTMLRMTKLFGGQTNLGNCSCGKQVRHTCRARRNRMRMLFAENDLEKIFHAVERIEVHRTANYSEKQIDALQTELQTLNSTVQAELQRLNTSVHELAMKVEQSSKSADDSQE